MAIPIQSLRWTRYAVVASIALNLFLLAFIGMEGWRRHRHDDIFDLRGVRAPLVAMPMENVVSQLSGRLPPDDAALLHAEFAAKLPALMALQRDAREAMERVRADIAQQPYDNARTQNDIAAARAARQKLGPFVEEILLEILPRMSDQGRRVLSEYRLRQRP